MAAYVRVWSCSLLTNLPCPPRRDATDISVAPTWTKRQKMYTLLPGLPHRLCVSVRIDDLRSSFLEHHRRVLPTFITSKAHAAESDSRLDPVKRKAYRIANRRAVAHELYRRIAFTSNEEENGLERLRHLLST